MATRQKHARSTIKASAQVKSNHGSSGMMKSWGSGAGASGGDGMYQVHEMQRRTSEIISDSHKNPVQAIAAAQALPVKMGQRFPPRAHAGWVEIVRARRATAGGSRSRPGG